ncbi:efflux RND transporter periplasmic adaptor subunit [Prosthecomicrobium sp. N25]|uniref:efflux RND transporter periplasmic adaptor subunit n=1 Tax=Prosthecomicrobium sp. N25 TaxID=3129254 RepID=UPI003077D027
MSEAVETANAAARAPHPLPAAHHVGRTVAWLILALSFAGAVGLGGYRLYYGPEVAVQAARRADLVKTVVATGHVETPYRVEIGSQITGVVGAVAVEEGEAVRKGDLLVTLETDELRAVLAQAEAAVAQASARLRQIREVSRPAAEQALRLADANLTNAQAAFERADQLTRNGFATRSALDEATRALEVARAQKATADLQLRTVQDDGSDTLLAETLLRQAEASRRTAGARLAYAEIRAPRDGVLISRSVENGMVVQPGKALLVLAPAGETQVVVQIDEKNVGLLRVGQSALASADAYPDRRFQATVSYINPAIDLNRASVEVKLRIPDPPAELRQDMTVSVDIEVARRGQTVVIPARVLHDPNTAAPYVLMVADGRAVARPVRLGLRAGDTAEVLEGVAPGDRLVPLAAGIRAGQRLRAVGP